MASTENVHFSKSVSHINYGRVIEIIKQSKSNISRVWLFIEAFSLKNRLGFFGGRLSFWEQGEHKITPDKTK